MAEPTIRWACITRILELLREREELANVSITPGYAGDEAGTECIWVDDVDGDMNVPVMRGPDAPVTYDDTFRLPIEIKVVADGKDHDETRARLAEIEATVIEVIARRSQLGALPGVISARITEARESSGEIRAVGTLAFAEVVTTVHYRINP